MSLDGIFFFFWLISKLKMCLVKYYYITQKQFLQKLVWQLKIVLLLNGDIFEELDEEEKKIQLDISET